MERIGILGEYTWQKSINEIFENNPGFKEKPFKHIEFYHPDSKKEDTFFSRIDTVLCFHTNTACYQTIIQAVRNSKNIFIAFPDKLTHNQLLLLSDLSIEANTNLWLSVPNLYHPYIKWINDNAGKPAYIETKHILSSPLSTENLFQVLFRELIFTMSIIGRDAWSLNSSVFSISSKIPDLINVHIEFDNFNSAYIQCGSIGEINKHEYCFFVPGKVLCVDFQEHNINILYNNDTVKPEKELNTPENNETLGTELIHFFRFTKGLEKNVLNHGLLENTIKIYQRILEKIQLKIS